MKRERLLYGCASSLLAKREILDQVPEEYAQNKLVLSVNKFIWQSPYSQKKTEALIEIRGGKKKRAACTLPGKLQYKLGMFGKTTDTWKKLSHEKWDLNVQRVPAKV